MLLTEWHIASQMGLLRSLLFFYSVMSHAPQWSSTFIEKIDYEHDLESLQPVEAEV